MGAHGGPRNQGNENLVFSIDAKNPKSTDYKENIVTDGLIFYTNSSNPKCTNGNTSAIDLVGNNIGTLNGGMTVEGTDWTFDGTDEYIDVDNLSSTTENDNQGSIEIWLKLDSTPLSQVHVFSINTTAALGYIRIFSDTNRDLSTSYTNGSYDKWRYILNSFTLNLGTWYHLVVTQDAVAPKFYVNGTLMAATQESANPIIDTTLWMNDASFDNARIGALQFNGNPVQGFWPGSISTVRYYNRELTPAEITQNYNAGRLATLTSLTSQTYTVNGGVYNNNDVWDFDGVNDYIDFDNSIIDNSSVISVSLWFKPPPSIGSSEVMVYIGDSGLASLVPLLIISLRSGKTNNLFISSNNNIAYSLLSDTPINTTGWNHVTVIKRGTPSSINDFDLYLNGELVTTADGANYTTGDNVDKIYLGCARNSGINSSYFGGDISNVKIYNRALTAQEVLTNYNRHREKFV